jgi:integrase
LQVGRFGRRAGSKFKKRRKKIAMGIYKRGDTYWYRFNWNGETIRETTKTSNRRVAGQIESARKVALARGEVGIIDPRKIPTLEKFAPRFTEAIETRCADKPATVSFYRDKLKCLTAHSQLASTRLDRIDEAMIDAYIQERIRTTSRRGKPLSPASVNRELATLRRMLRLAYDWNVISRVPRIHLLRGERNREFVLGHDLEPVYLSALKQPLRDVAMVLLDTGLRIGEVLKLEWTNVHLEPAKNAKYGYLTVRASDAKNSKSRNIPLTDRASSVLNVQGREASNVFHRSDDSPLYQTWLNQQHAAVREALKLPDDFVLHSLRHTFGTRLGEAGADAFTIMKLMGHSTVTVSQRYVHPSPEFMESAVSRLEDLNTSKQPAKHGVGTKLGTETPFVSVPNEQVA